MESLVYNIPAARFNDYQNRDVIIRSADPVELAHCLSRADPLMVRFVQLYAGTDDASTLEGVALGLPVEIVLKNPAADFVQLYAYKTLLDSHPVRIAIPVEPGFSKAVKQALSLNFAVRLSFTQPAPDLMAEVFSVLDLYLHRSSVRQPVEFFHTMLLSFYQGDSQSLWDITEEDPDTLRFVTDNGSEVIARQVNGLAAWPNLDDFVARFEAELLAENRECVGCQFLSNCRGYFKLPDRSYDCGGIKKVLTTLADAAAEVRRDLSAHTELEVQYKS